MMRAHRCARVFLAVLTASLSLTGCHSWRPLYQTTGGSLVEYTKPVRLTMRDGRRIALASARISGDTIHGALSKASGDSALTLVRLPMRDVSVVEEKQFNAGRTISVVIASVGVALLALVVAISQLAYFPE